MTTIFNILSTTLTGAALAFLAILGALLVCLVLAAAFDLLSGGMITSWAKEEVNRNNDL